VNLLMLCRYSGSSIKLDPEEALYLHRILNTADRNIGIEFWFKGEIEDDTEFFTLYVSYYLIFRQLKMTQRC